VANIRHILNQLPPAQGIKQTLVSDQNVYDIVRHVMSMHNECQRDYDIIAQQFWQGNELNTCRYIFDFCKKNIPYSIEPAKSQTVKSPAQILGDAIKGDISQDCKHYALICNGIIHALERAGYPIKSKYRFCSDVQGEHYPKHVFCIVPTASGEIWLDPVLPEFNQYHKYYYIKDKTPKMALYKVSGVGDQEPGGSYEDYIAGFGADIGKHGKGKKKVQNLWRDTKRTVAKGSLSLPRNAFLLLVSANGLNLAKLFYVGAQDPQMLQKIKNKWVDIGGSWNALQHAINKGYSHYLYYGKHKRDPKHHQITGFGEGYTIGEPISATITAAAAVLAAFATIIKELKQKQPEQGPAMAPYMPGGDIAPQQGPAMGPQYSPGQMMDYNNQYTPAGPGPGEKLEIPQNANAIEKTAYVATQWGTGIKDFIENNRGTVLTLGGLTLGVMGIKYIFSPTTKRK